MRPHHTTAQDRPREPLAASHAVAVIEPRTPDVGTEARERARGLTGSLSATRVVEYGAVTFAADGTAFVEAVIEVPPV